MKPIERPPQSSSSEPPECPSRLPVWIVLALMVLLIWAGFYIARNAGGFDPRVYAPFQSSNELAKAQPTFSPGALIDRGRVVYARLCSQCHQYSGMGDPAKAPPLVGAEWVLGAGPGRTGRILLDGFTGEVNIQGKMWNLSMPSWKEQLSDEDIAATLSYIRSEWGHRASVIRPEQIGVIRAAERNRSVPWTAAELSRIPEQ
jgi:mono/diheme cytochrome c family protein